MQGKRIAEGEHSFIKLPLAIKIFVLSIFEWPFYTEFTVIILNQSTMSTDGVFMACKTINFRVTRKQRVKSA